MGGGIYMTKIDDLYIKYGNIDPNDLTKKSADCLRGELSAFQKSELQTMEDHKKYIELLAKCRSFSYESMKTLGSQFLKTLGSLLAVGEDGVYNQKDSEGFINLYGLPTIVNSKMKESLKNKDK